jgi:hypothetical protein
MNSTGFAAGAMLAVLAFASIGAQAQTNPPATPSAPMATPDAAPATANFCGVVVQLPASECIAVKSAGQPLYEITSVKPHPLKGILVSGTGELEGTTECVGSTHLSHVRLHTVQSCPLAAAPAQ